MNLSLQQLLDPVDRLLPAFVLGGCSCNSRMVKSVLFWPDCSGLDMSHSLVAWGSANPATRQEVAHVATACESFRRLGNRKPLSVSPWRT
jgi:hypothetical protein